MYIYIKKPLLPVCKRQKETQLYHDAMLEQFSAESCQILKMYPDALFKPSI